MWGEEGMDEDEKEKKPVKHLFSSQEKNLICAALCL